MPLRSSWHWRCRQPSWTGAARSEEKIRTRSRLPSSRTREELSRERCSAGWTDCWCLDQSGACRSRPGPPRMRRAQAAIAEVRVERAARPSKHERCLFYGADGPGCRPAAGWPVRRACRLPLMKRRLSEAALGLEHPPPAPARASGRRGLEPQRAVHTAPICVVVKPRPGNYRPTARCTGA